MNIADQILDWTGMKPASPNRKFNEILARLDEHDRKFNEVIERLDDDDFSSVNTSLFRCLFWRTLHLIMDGGGKVKIPGE